MSAPFTGTAWAARLKDMPIWAFHGAKDSLVLIGGSEELIDALRSLDNDVRLTVLPGRDHDILDAYKNQELLCMVLGTCASTEEAVWHSEVIANSVQQLW